VSKESSSSFKNCCEPWYENNLDFQPELINELFIAETSGHFWFLSRLEFIKALFLKYVSKESRVLDIGSGSGWIASRLSFLGFSIAVGDVHLKSLELARRAGIDECYIVNVYQPPFVDEFDVICLFDVIEHLDDDEKALFNVGRMLKAGGKVFITVPAHAWLWNSHDDLSGHKRRYTSRSLLQTVSNAGFRVIKSSYIFRLIVPLLLLRRLIGKMPESEKQKSKKDLFSINPVLNRILFGLCEIDRKMGEYLPDLFGGSILLVAEKI